MNVLILGSGGREHALAWKIAQSAECDNLYIGPGNGGTSELGTNLSINPSDFYEVAVTVKKHGIDMLIVGPEAPLVGGIRDYFESSDDFRNLIVIGPGKKGAELEGSKDFAKAFMRKYAIPTAPSATFKRNQLSEAMDFLEKSNPPFVLKADGLAGGKGVLILEELEEAKNEIELMLEEGKFGAASDKVVIENFLEGIEISVFALTDGESYMLLPSAKDYKRIGESDTGLNTGGMGAVSPVPFADEELMNKIEERIVAPTVEGLKREDIPYVGFLFFGLMVVHGDPFVIEYNVRMGDPETEVVLPRVKSDLLKHLKAAGQQRLKDERLLVDERYTTTVMLVSEGYPGKYEKGKKLEIKNTPSSKQIFFHAGTKGSGSDLETSGGRVIACTAYGDDLKTALETSYALTEKVDFEGKHFRKDIGKDLLT